ncbi:MAG: superoxide dismutase family protein [Clostridiales bacterium]|nr:superoxide dismutase family protein [Candidatus Cacconaster stercorequi]
MASNNCSADRSQHFLSLLQQCPTAAACLSGGEQCPSLRGEVKFYQTNSGVLVAAQVCGLPSPSENCCGTPFFALHIHEGNSCDGDCGDSFSGAKGHYNPCRCQHPHHAGDLPPLLGSNGYAFSVFLTDRFSVQDIIGKTVIIHRDPDDFTTQPAGNAGEKIACGVIRCRCRAQ